MENTWTKLYICKEKKKLDWYLYEKENWLIINCQIYEFKNSVYNMKLKWIIWYHAYEDILCTEIP